MINSRLAAVRRTALDPLHEMGASSAVLRTAAKRGVLAYHVIFGAYGFWLPNDPRGSWSDFVAAWELFRADDLRHKNSRLAAVRRTARAPTAAAASG